MIFSFKTFNWLSDWQLLIQIQTRLKIQATGEFSLVWINGVMRDKKELPSFLYITALMRSLGCLATKRTSAFTQFLKITMRTSTFTEENCIASMRSWNFKETTTLIVPRVSKLFLKNAIIKLLYLQTLAVLKKRLNHIYSASSLSSFRMKWHFK